MQILLLILAILTVLGVAIDVMLLIFVLKTKQEVDEFPERVTARVFGSKAKRKPMFNDDEKAWLKENDRA